LGPSYARDAENEFFIRFKRARTRTLSTLFVPQRRVRFSLKNRCRNAEGIMNGRVVMDLCGGGKSERFRSDRPRRAGARSLFAETSTVKGVAGEARGTRELMVFPWFIYGHIIRRRRSAVFVPEA
jgi:hypothetical protein